MMNGKRLAQVAHGELIERLAEAQQRMVKIKLLEEMFGKDALPPLRIFRSHNDALSSAADGMKRLKETTMSTIQENMATLRQIEYALHSADQADAESFGEWVAERMKAGRDDQEKEAAPAPKWRDYTFDGAVVVFQNADDAQNYIESEKLQDARLRRHEKSAWKIQVLR